MSTSEIIHSIVITEFDLIDGPVAKAFFPLKMDEDLLKFIAKKSFAALYEADEPSQTVTLVDFASYDLKGLAHPFSWEEEARRGKVGEGAISILFEEKYDLILYKYRHDFQIHIKKFITEYLLNKNQHADRDTMNKLVEKLYNEISDRLLRLANDELNSVESNNAFPEDIAPGKYTSYTAKVIVIGDPSVGKSSMILQYTNKAFKRSYIPTIGANITGKKMVYQDKIVELVIWDLAGQAKFNRLRDQFYLGSLAAILVFDLTKLDTFMNINKWYDDLKRALRDFRDLKLILCGNKADLKDQIKIPNNIIEKRAKEWNIPYFDASALTGQNVDRIFEEIVRLIFQPSE
jgi:small GTP-binding protein